MLKFSEAQMEHMRESEMADFVRRVHEELVGQHPTLLGDEQLLPQLQAAHGAALRLGIEEAGHRTQFLHVAAFAPGFWRESNMVGWLNKPGATPDQRWRDLLATVKDISTIGEP